MTYKFKHHILFIIIEMIFGTILGGVFSYSLIHLFDFDKVNVFLFGYLSFYIGSFLGVVGIGYFHCKHINTISKYRENVLKAFLGFLQIIILFIFYITVQTSTPTPLFRLPNIVDMLLFTLLPFFGIITGFNWNNFVTEF